MACVDLSVLRRVFHGFHGDMDNYHNINVTIPPNVGRSGGHRPFVMFVILLYVT
jgi:hypothetical protein